METDKLWEVTLTGLAAKLSVDFWGKEHSMANCWVGMSFLGMENSSILVDYEGVRKSSLWNTLS